MKISINFLKSKSKVYDKLIVKNTRNLQISVQSKNKILCLKNWKEKIAEN